MPKLQIIGAPQSTFVRVARIAAEEKGVDYELVPAPPRSDEVSAIHPLGKIPVMRHGDVTLCESKAIATYIDRAFDGPCLFPDSLIEAVQLEQWVSLFNTGLDPSFSTYIGAYFFPGTADGSPNRARIEEVAPKLRQALNILDRATSRGAYLVGKGFTFADIAVLPALYYLRDLPESGRHISELKALPGYIQRHTARTSFKATTPPPLTADDIATATRILSVPVDA